MAGDEGGVASEIEAGFGFERADRGKARRHQGWLRIGGQREFVLGALEHQFGQMLAERLVDFLQNRPCLDKLIRQSLGHADGLRSLARKNESSRRPAQRAKPNLIFCLRSGLLLALPSTPVKRPSRNSFDPRLANLRPNPLVRCESSCLAPPACKAC